MIACVNQPYEADFGVIDGTTVRLFDFGGLFLRDSIFDVNMITRQRIYQAISVLSSNGVVEVCLFGKQTTKKIGNLQTVEKLVKEQGYFKRLQLSGKEQGIRYRQMIFVYMDNVDVQSIFNKV